MEIQEIIKRMRGERLPMKQQLKEIDEKIKELRKSMDIYSKKLHGILSMLHMEVPKEQSKEAMN